jgi:hypothetical protein
VALVREAGSQRRFTGRHGVLQQQRAGVLHTAPQARPPSAAGLWSNQAAIP